MQNEKYLQEDEIDLRELFKTVWNYKRFLLVFTLAITFLAIVYVFIKKPIYEVKSIVRIGYIDDKLIESGNVLEQKLRTLYSVDIPQKFTEAGIVSNITNIKKADNFLEISTQAFSNDVALSKNKEVLKTLQDEYKFKIDEYILKTQLNIKNLEDKIKYVTDVEKVDIEKNIEKIKQQSIPRVEDEIALLKNVELKTIENKLEFNQEKLKEYQENVTKISKQKSNDNSQNMLMAIQLLSYQNLILSTQNSIENLIKEKENLINLRLKDLEVKKENILNEDMRKEEIKLNIDLVKKLDDLKESLTIEKLKISGTGVANSEIVGDYIVDDHPAKPKKALIIVVAFVTGFILSIFLIFFIEFVKSFKKEETK